jgi:hypothetical protein
MFFFLLSFMEVYTNKIIYCLLYNYNEKLRLIYFESIVNLESIEPNICINLMSIEILCNLLQWI